MQDGTREDEAGDQHCPHIERQGSILVSVTLFFLSMRHLLTELVAYPDIPLVAGSV